MIDQELYSLIEKVVSFQAEFQNIEVKAAHEGCPSRLYDTLSAFSNQDSGGVILFGLDERKNFEAVGVYDVHDLQKRVNEQCKQMVPLVRPIFTVVDYQGHPVVSAEIPSVDIGERPCYYSGVGRIRGSYVRVGDSDEPMSEYEIYSYEAYRKKYQDDIRLNDQCSFKAIDQNLFQSYVEKVISQKPNLARLPKEEIWELLNLVKEGTPTLTCILLFSLYPQIFYPQYTINAMLIPGNERGDALTDGTRFLANRRIEGTIPEMLQETMVFLEKHMDIRTVIRPETGERADQTEYPVTALREAVLNALIHRDYSCHTESMPIEILMFYNRIEIRSPGGLYGRVRLEQLGRMQPDTRNPVLARAMETLGYTENRYSGIPTIRRVLKEAGMPEPVFQNLRNQFCVIFYKKQVEPEISVPTPERDLLEFCKIPRSRKEIADYLGIKTVFYASKTYIEPLLKTGALSMTKPEKPRSKDQKYYTSLHHK